MGDLSDIEAEARSVIFKLVGELARASKEDIKYMKRSIIFGHILNNSQLSEWIATGQVRVPQVSGWIEEAIRIHTRREHSGL